MLENKPLLGRLINFGHALAPNQACWLLNEGTGPTSYDISGNRNDLSHHSDVTWGAGYTEYDGTDDDSENSAMHNLGTGIGTLVLKVRINTAANLDYIFAATDSSDNNAILLRQLDTNELSLLAYNTGGTLVVSQVTGDGHFTVGQWYHWVLTWNSEAMYLYEDSKVLLSDTAIAGTLRNTDKICIGGLFTFGHCHMDVEYAYMYNRMLSAEEVRQLYISPFCFMHQTPIHLWAGTLGGVSIPVFMRYYRNQRVA